MTNIDCTKWIAFFTKNKQNRPEPDWETPICIPLRARKRLEQSLREFQLGDGGGPGKLIAWNVERYRNKQSDLGKVLDLWFAEEHEHSRLLGKLLTRYGVSPISNHWSFTLFCSLRRNLGIDFELQILTLTELSSTAYYRLLRSYGIDPALKQALSLILRDEAGHLAFQCDRIACAQTERSWAVRILWQVQFLLCGFGAASVLYISHGGCLRSLGLSPARFYREAWKQFRRFLKRVERRVASKVSSRHKKIDLPANQVAQSV